MRFLGIGDYNELGDMYLRLQAKGHEVRVFIGSEGAHDVLEGLVVRTPDWRRELEWIRQAGEEGVIIFETATQGELQDNLRAQGFQVVGGCAYGDRLEGERDFGQEIMRSIGLKTAPSHVFRDFNEVIEFISKNPQRFVYKHHGSSLDSTHNYVGQLDDGADMVARLQSYRDKWRGAAKPDFILMEHVTGLEIGVGAYFNGKEFLKPALLDWEHKRFFPGDLGELTGEMGTVVTYDGAEKIFNLTLAKMAPLLKQTGYCGYINMNAIINEGGLYPLEFTCRFGYPGFAICDSLHEEGWDFILKRLAQGGNDPIKTKNGFAVGIVISVPPFPYEKGYAELSQGLPISFRKDLTPQDEASIHFAEAAKKEGQWVCAGTNGYVMVVTGWGKKVENAQQEAYARVQKISIPNMRYRNDIGNKVAWELGQLKRWGYL